MTRQYLTVALAIAMATAPVAASTAPMTHQGGTTPSTTALDGSYFMAQHKAGGGHKHGAKQKTRNTNVKKNRNVNVNKNTNVRKNNNVNVNRNNNVNVNKNNNVNVNKDVNVNVDKNVNVNVNRHVTVVTREPGWRGVHWGAVAFGVTLGAIIVVAANTPPPPPDPSLCWTWTNSAYTEGYWYYCDGN